MASAPPTTESLPLLFNDLVPLSSVEHAKWKAKQTEAAPFLVKNHAIPITVDEFAMAQRFYPIIFSAAGADGPQRRREHIC
jgi:SapC